jgi:drug/metabolite transporter (DMT)-like permease
MPQTRTRLLVAFGIVYVVWGSTYLAIHYAVQTIPPLLMAGARFLVAGSVLYVWSLFRDGARPTARQWRNTAVIGTLLLLGGNGAVVWAEVTVPSGTAALLVAIVPLWMVLLDWLRPGGHRPATGVLVGVVAGLVGMGVLVGPDSLHGSGPIDRWGALALILGSLSWATGSVYARHADLPSGMATSGMEMLAGGVGCIVVALATGEAAHFHPAAVSGASIAGYLYLVVAGSIIAFSAYSFMVRNATPAAVSTYAYVNPIIAVVLGWLIANEPVTGRTILGAAIIVASVGIISVMANRSSSTPRSQANVAPAPATSRRRTA